MIRARKALLFCGVLATLLSPSLSFTQDIRGAWTLEDQRPVSETKRRGVSGSSSIFSCNYAISIMDDRGQVEARTISLQRVLEQKLGSKLSGKKVILRQYLISWNGGSIARQETREVFPGGVGVLGAGMIGMGANCPKEKVPVGWYDRSEVTNSNPPFIGVISVEIDGRVFSGRYVISTDFPFPPPSALPGTRVLRERKEYWIKGVTLAIDKANSSFADKLNAELP